MDTGNALPVMFNNMDEVKFLLSHLKVTDSVLEWGSGGSTLELAKHVNRVVSIEHDKNWFDKIKGLAPLNVDIHYVPRNKEEASGCDGTLSDYFDYINYPKILGKKFNVILVDGRARVECAKVAVELLAEGGFIFIHDYRHPQNEYRRFEYEVVEEFLEYVDGAFAMHNLKPKQKKLV